jgi:hypothetical protein
MIFKRTIRVLMASLGIGAALSSAANADDVTLSKNRELAIPKCYEFGGTGAEQVKKEFLVWAEQRNFFDPDSPLFFVDSELVICRCNGFYTVGVPVEDGGLGTTHIFFFRAREAVQGDQRLLDTESTWTVAR